MPENVRENDPYRQTTGKPISGQKNEDVARLATDEVPDTNPSAQSKQKQFAVAAKAATADQAAENAVTIEEDGATITSVTYTPGTGQAAPATGNSRTWTLAGTEGTIATYTQDNTKTLVSSTPVNFTISNPSVSEETLTIASAHSGATGSPDPGGTLTVTYSF